MRVGLIAPPWLSVPPRAYGGTEGVIDGLARGLVAVGHDVELFTVGESTCPVPRRWRYPTGREPIGDALIESAHVLSAYEELAHVDLVHDHTSIGPLLAHHRRLGQPVVATLHSPFTADVRRLSRTITPAIPLICISEDQRASAPDIPVARVIRHGIDADRFPLGQGRGGYLLFLGRMSPDKGAHRAVAVARAAGAALLLAAKMRIPAEHEYFREQVEPFLGDGIEYVGEVDVAERLRLLQGARALLNPIQWHEPFGMVMIEALACGTPVIAEAVGAAPEIVEDGMTGFLCTDTDAMVRAVGRIDTIDRTACRRAVVTRFSTQRMVTEHLALYEDVLDAAPCQDADLHVDLVRGA